jgi:hypothetical protein
MPPDDKIILELTEKKVSCSVNNWIRIKAWTKTPLFCGYEYILVTSVYNISLCVSQIILTTKIKSHGSTM